MYNIIWYSVGLSNDTVGYEAAVSLMSEPSEAVIVRRIGAGELFHVLAEHAE